jgi:Fe-S-cluster-containing dehydrogenase component
MAKYAMVIDLQKCVGCGACALACKTENNTQDRTNGQTFNWADHQIEKGGKFPDVSYTNRPVLCNHCTDAACVAVCPVTPKAMYKGPNGITLHNDERCIGCRACQAACPYSVMDASKDNAQYSVISFNDHARETHPYYRDTREFIRGGTASGAEVARKTGGLPPHKTRYTHADYKDVRRKGVVEKCMLCAHRVLDDADPYCVASCPSGARVFGDLEDSNSEVSRLLRAHDHEVLKPEAGTKPNVYYIRSFKPAAVR